MKQRDLLMTGRLGLLAAHLAVRFLARPGTTVRCLADPVRFSGLEALATDAARGRAGRDAGDPVERIAAGLRRIASGRLADLDPETEVWHFADVGPERSGDPAPGLPPALAAAGLAVDFVRTPYAGGASWTAGPAPATGGPPPRVRRTFTTSWTIAPVLPAGPAGEGFLHLLAALHGVESEIDGRLPDYFDYRALRCHAPAGARLHPIRVERAVDVIAALAERSAAGRFTVASPRGVDLDRLCERIGAAYGLSLLAEPDPGRLNAVDQAFSGRLAGLAGRLRVPEPGEIEATCRAAGVPAEELALGDQELDELIAAACARQRAHRRELDRAAAALRASAEPHRIERAGEPLAYVAAGPASDDGEPAVVLINALGQGLGYWWRLIEVLRRRRRVVAWELRGVVASPSPLSTADHAADLEAILDHAGLGRVHLVAWCTGPRIAVELLRRRPRAVESMAFLNSTLKYTGGPAELDTDYERNFEPLCKVLGERPAMARSITDSLVASAAGGELDPEQDADLVGLLESVPAALRPEVRRPFQDADSVVRYAGQLVDLWSYDLRRAAAGLEVPVLCLGAEHDRIASPEASRELAALLPRGRWLVAAGASHYLLHDRAEALGELLEAFFADPDGVGAPARSGEGGPPEAAPGEPGEALIDAAEPVAAGGPDPRPGEVLAP